MRRKTFAAALAVGLLEACAARGPVTRVADGETFDGRPIAPEAYAAVLRASVLEARGDAPGALAELERALGEDPGSPEIVTSIARLLCQSFGSTDAAEEALGSFEDALALDPTYAPAWLGLAECRERRKDLRGALEAAERAAHYDPSSVGATRAVARLLFALERPSEAWTWLEALAILAPESREAEQAILEEATKRRDVTRESRARRALSTLGVSDQRSQEAALDDALSAGDLARARVLATGLSLRPSAVALRALERSPRVALEQAAFVLAADPSDSDAWIAALAAADELGDDARFADIVRALDAEPLFPSPRAIAAFQRLLARRVGRDAGDAFARAQRNP
jgi:tetratricopeptide (TPR) repeat protein